MSQDSQPRGEGDESGIIVSPPSAVSRLENLRSTNIKLEPTMQMVNSDSVQSFVRKLPL